MAPVSLIKNLFLFLFVGILGILPLKGQISINKAKIDRHAQRAPKKLHQDLPNLTSYLIEKATNDFEKARAIYTWITLNITYDHNALELENKRINKSIKDILSRRKAICMGYADLFEQMCKLAGLQAYVVDGYSKGTLTSEPDLSAPDHSWNVVQIEEQWYLLDATWGSSLALQSNFTTINEDYFLSSPDNFILTHLPALPMWQLLDCPISTDLYKKTSNNIKTHLSNCSGAFVYRDSIQNFLSLSIPARRLRSSLLTYRFNSTPKNKKELGHALMDYAGILSDSVDQFQDTNQLNRVIALQERIIKLSKQAKSCIDFHNWQKELFAGTLINQVVAIFQQTQSLEKVSSDIWNDLIAKLESAQAILEDTESSYFTQMALKQCEEYIKILMDYAR